MPPKLTLTEEQIDDLLYLSRINEAEELLSEIKSIKESSSSSSFSTSSSGQGGGVGQGSGTGVKEEDVIEAIVDSNTGNNLFHMAAANGHVDILTTLLPYLPSPSASTTTGTSSTPLPHPTLIHPNHSGNTPLHWACLNGHLPFVKSLIKQGHADPTIVNTAGHDAVYEAEIAEKSEVVEWLLRECEALEEAIGVGGIGGEGKGDDDDDDDEEEEAEEKEGRVNGEGKEKGKGGEDGCR